MPRSRNGARTRALVLASAAAWAACVSYDPTGPHAAAISGVFAAELITILTNEIQVRHDTTAVTLVLRDSSYRGRFYGYYRFADGDSGRVAGTLYPGGRVEVTHFGGWPLLAYGGYLQRLYPLCAFARLGPIYVLGGQLRGDTLVVGGQGSLPCSNQENGATVEREAAFEFGLVGIRQ